MNEKLNSKHEIRNPKQTRILKIQIFNNLFGHMIHENIYFCLQEVRVSGSICMNAIPTRMFGRIHRIIRRFDKPLYVEGVSIFG